MSNHGYITTRQKLTKKKLFDLLQEINQERFGGLIKITAIEPSDTYDGAWFEMELFENCWPCFWLTSAHKIEHSHGPGGDFRWWIEFTFANNIAIKINGWLSDDGVEGKWRGKKNNYPTLRSYVENQWSSNQVPEIRNMFINMAIENAKKLRPDLIPFFEKKKENKKCMSSK